MDGKEAKLSPAFSDKALLVTSPAVGCFRVGCWAVSDTEGHWWGKAYLYEVPLSRSILVTHH